MRVSIGCLTLVACSYQPSPSTPGGDDGPPTPSDGIDAPVDGVDAPVPGDTSQLAFCDHAQVDDLRMCFTFDNDTLDRSGHANHALSSGVTFVQGVDGQALVTTAGTVQVPDDSSLDVTAFTIRMRISPSNLPTGVARMGLIENDVYRMFVLAGGVIRCAINGNAPHEAITTAGIPTGQFTRVTCTYNGNVIKVYFDGVQKAASVPVNDTLHNVGTLTPIGQSEPANGSERFAGAIDDLEVFGTLQTP